MISRTRAPVLAVALAAMAVMAVLSVAFVAARISRSGGQTPSPVAVSTTNGNDWTASDYGQYVLWKCGLCSDPPFVYLIDLITDTIEPQSWDGIRVQLREGQDGKLEPVSWTTSCHEAGP